MTFLGAAFVFRRWSPLLALCALVLVTGCQPGEGGAVATPTPSPSVAEPAPPAVVVPPVDTGGAPLGANVDAEPAFADVMKTAGPYRKLDGDEPARTDERGWPVEDFTVTTGAVPAGDYLLTFASGDRPSVRANDRAVHDVTWNRNDGRGTATIQVRATTTLKLAFRNVGSGAHDVRLLRPGYPAAGTPTFTREYVAGLRDLRPAMLRFTAFTATDGNLVSQWAERTTPSDARQTGTLTRTMIGADGKSEQRTSRRGGAWEYAVELANAVGSDLWLNVPSQADDDYVRQLAALVHRRLSPNLNVWLEYSNALWDAERPQTYWNRQAARTEVSAGDSALDDGGATVDTRWGDRRAAERLVEIGSVFRDAFGGAGRIRPVLGTSGSATDGVVDQLGYVQNRYGTPADFLYALGTVPGATAGIGPQVDLAGRYRLVLAAYDAPSELTGGVDAYLRSWYAAGGGPFVWRPIGTDQAARDAFKRARAG